MQIFNALNNRRLDDRFNILEGISRNWLFVAILCVMIGGQTMIMFVGGVAFSVTRLDGTQWGISIALGFFSLPVGVFIRLIPDERVRKCIPAFFARRRTPAIIVSNGDDRWNQGLVAIRDELALIKRIRGGRLRNLKLTISCAKAIFKNCRLSFSRPDTPSSGSGNN
jgi:Ca2+-transporting ATPase